MRKNPLFTAGASYLEKPMHNPKELIADARRMLKGVDFDTMVGRGLSGALAIPILANAMRKNFLIIRKEGDGTHSAWSAEGAMGRRWIFVDDLIASGRTREAVLQGVEKLVTSMSYQFGRKKKPVYVGDYLYYDIKFHNREADEKRKQRIEAEYRAATEAAAKALKTSEQVLNASLEYDGAGRTTIFGRDVERNLNNRIYPTT